MTNNNSGQKYFVVGGGTFGLSTALALSERVLSDRIFVLDRCQIPAVDAASTDINKALRASYGSDELYSKMALLSIQKFREWNSLSKIFHETGVLLSTGSSVKDDDINTSYENSSYRTLCALGMESHLLIGTKQNSALKYLQETFPGGYMEQKAGWADSEKTIRLIANILKMRGVKFITGNAGNVSRIVEDGVIETADGSRYEGIIIIASGAWTVSLLPQLKGIIKAVGQPLIKFKIPSKELNYYAPNCVWNGDITNTGFYGFPATSDGIVKIGHHGYYISQIRSGYTNFRGMQLSIPKTVVSNPKDGMSIPLESVQKFRRFFEQCFPQWNELDIYQTRMCW